MKNIKKQIHSIAEPGVQYSSDSVIRTVPPVKDTDATYNHEEYMTVSEYFDKVRKALDLRYPYIVRAEYAGDVRLNIWFSDGTTQSVDFRPFIQSHPHPQYNRYIEPRYFKKFRLEQGNVVWGKNWDLVFPLEQLYSGKII